MTFGLNVQKTPE